MGSEMCIRDRHWTRWACAPLLRRTLVCHPCVRSKSALLRCNSINRLGTNTQLVHVTFTVAIVVVLTRRRLGGNQIIMLAALSSLSGRVGRCRLRPRLLRRTRGRRVGELLQLLLQPRNTLGLLGFVKVFLLETPSATLAPVNRRRCNNRLPTGSNLWRRWCLLLGTYDVLVQLVKCLWRQFINVKLNFVVFVVLFSRRFVLVDDTDSPVKPLIRQLGNLGCKLFLLVKGNRADVFIIRAALVRFARLSRRICRGTGLLRAGSLRLCFVLALLIERRRRTLLPLLSCTSTCLLYTSPSPRDS